MGFGRQVLGTYLVRLFLIPAGLLNGVIVARWLGPAGQGTFAAIAAYVAVAGMVAGLGLGTAATRIAAAQPARTAALAANARWTGLLAGMISIGVLVGLRQSLPAQAFGGIPPWLLVVGSLAIPFSLTASQLQAIVLGRGRVRAFNAMAAADRLALLSASVVLLVGLGLGVGAIVAASTVWAISKFAIYHGLLGTEGWGATPDAALLRSMARVSLRAWITVLLSFLVLRSDVVLINGILGTDATGVYSIAVQLAEFLMILPGAVGTLLFPRVASGGERANVAFTAKVSRHVAVVVTLACVALALVGDRLVLALYGAPYAEAASALRILLPGVWCLALQGILSNDLAGRDYPKVLPRIWLVTLLLNVGLNVWLIPRHGIDGAAAASSLAYGLAFCGLVLYWLRRFPEVRLRGLLVISRLELRELPHHLRRILKGASPSSEAAG